MENYAVSIELVKQVFRYIKLVDMDRFKRGIRYNLIERPVQRDVGRVKLTLVQER